MIRRSLLVLSLILAAGSSAFAQRPKDDDAFVNEKPTIGEFLPDLTVTRHGENQTRRCGHHAVLVFGCLT